MNEYSLAKVQYIIIIKVILVVSIKYRIFVACYIQNNETHGTEK